MKKMFISVMVLAFSTMAMATRTASVRINIQGSDATYSFNTLRLVEDDARNATAENGYDASCVMSQANENSTLIYGFIGTEEYSTIQTNDLTGLEIGFVTNQVDANYTLTFTNFSGNEFTLHDKVANQYITINASTPAYAFSVEAAQVGQVAINDRFVIESAPAAKAICFKYEKLELTKYDGANVQVFADGSAIAALTQAVAGDAQFDIDLSGLASGKYKVVITIPGVTDPEEYIIDVKPAVTVVP